MDQAGKQSRHHGSSLLFFSLVTDRHGLRPNGWQMPEFHYYSFVPLKSVCANNIQYPITPALLPIRITYLIYLNILIEWKVL